MTTNTVSAGIDARGRSKGFHLAVTVSRGTVHERPRTTPGARPFEDGGVRS
jgi:hypothetical protein